MIMTEDSKRMTLDDALEARLIFDRNLSACGYEKRGERRLVLVYALDGSLSLADWVLECYEFELRNLGLRRVSELQALMSTAGFSPALQPTRPPKWRSREAA